MSGDRPTSRLMARPPSWATTLTLAAAMLAGGGGLGSGLTGSSVAQEVGVLRTQIATQNTSIAGKLDLLAEKLDRSSAQVADIEGRVRLLERESQQGSDMLRRIKALEGRSQ